MISILSVCTVCVCVRVCVHACAVCSFVDVYVLGLHCRDGMKVKFDLRTFDKKML